MYVLVKDAPAGHYEAAAPAAADPAPPPAAPAAAAPAAPAAPANPVVEPSAVIEEGVKYGGDDAAAGGAPGSSV